MYILYVQITDHLKLVFNIQFYKTERTIGKSVPELARFTTVTDLFLPSYTTPRRSVAGIFVYIVFQ